MAFVRLTSVALVLLIAAAHAQAPTRVRGTISAFDGKTLLVNNKVEVLLGDKTEIVFAQPIALAEIKPGDFLAIMSMKRPDGTLTALEARRFPKPLNPRHGPLEGREDQTMTNATVSAMVQAAGGRELTMTYEGGAQKIMVPESASLSTLVPGQRSHLVPGAPVNLTMDANRVALRIQVGPKT
jgi:hypothetical protein